MVREALGDEAVIISTREENGGASVCLTAAIEPSSYDREYDYDSNFELGDGGTQAAESDDWLQYDDEDEVSAVEEEITDVMLRHSVPEDVMDAILSCATVIGLESPGISLIAAIEHLFNFRPLPEGAYHKPMMMIGAPGSGKTLVTAKMAARGAMAGLDIGVITTDTVRAGGIEQLEAFTKLLDIDLIQALNPMDLPFILEEMEGEGKDQILIDTSGFNPFDSTEMKGMAQLIGSANVEPYLIMPAGGDAEESGEIARACAVIGAYGVIPSRLDIARRFGGVLAAAYHGGLPFADMASTSSVVDGLEAVTPQNLSRLVMPSAYRKQQDDAPQSRGTEHARRIRKISKGTQ